jgi:hypothetical protein
MKAATAWAQVWDISEALCEFGQPAWLEDYGILGAKSSPIHSLSISSRGCNDRHYRNPPPGYVGDCWTRKCYYSITLIVVVSVPGQAAVEMVIGTGYVSCTGRVCCLDT